MLSKPTKNDSRQRESTFIARRSVVPRVTALRHFCVRFCRASAFLDWITIKDCLVSEPGLPILWPKKNLSETGRFAKEQTICSFQFRLSRSRANGGREPVGRLVWLQCGVFLFSVEGRKQYFITRCKMARVYGFHGRPMLMVNVSRHSVCGRCRIVTREFNFFYTFTFVV